jgi:hypothetical protein
MDWARDNAGLSDTNLDSVFKYEEKSTTVVRMLAGENVSFRTCLSISLLIGSQQPIIWSLEGKVEWNDWIQHVRESVLILNDRLVA